MLVQRRSSADKPANIDVCRGRRRPSNGRKYRYREFALRNLDIDLPNLKHQLQTQLCSAHCKVCMISCDGRVHHSARRFLAQVNTLESVAQSQIRAPCQSVLSHVIVTIIQTLFDCPAYRSVMPIFSSVLVQYLKCIWWIHLELCFPKKHKHTYIPCPAVRGVN